MSILIQKARKGNSDAMQTLYNDNKERVLFLCTLLLENTSVACNATSRIFRNMWDLIIAEQIETEEEFSRAVIEKAVNHCKSSIAKKDTKAFRTPQNKNFANASYSADKLIGEDDLALFIVRNLPPLHRFIYVLNALFDYNESDLAKVFKINEATVKLALDAEEANIKRLLSLNKQQTGEECSLTVDDFHRDLEGIGDAVAVPGGVNTTVILGIDSVCDPILEKVKKQRNKMLIYIGIGLLCLCVVAFAVWGISKAVSDDDTDGTEDTSADTGDDDVSDEVTYTTEYTATHYADIVIDGYGTITVALDANQAPITVENFVGLANNGFYDGLTFHRIMDGFMMQGGDPNGDGSGGNTDEDGNEINIEGEFYYNGSDNMLSHIRGAISMARNAYDYDSASSQFFIVHTSDYTDSLDGLYAVFGYVTEGLDIVDAICEATYTFEDDGETVVTDEQPVITSITIREVDESEDEGEETTAIEATVAEVTAITDGTLTLTTYTLTEAGADYEITDAASVDFSNYEISSETEEYTIDSDAVIYVSEDGALAESDSAAIVVGDKLVIYNDSDDVITIVIYHAESEENTDES